MNFFIDTNLSEKLANGMKAFGEQVIHLKEIFPEDTPDAKWLEYIGKHRMILVTRDLRILRKPAELRAIKIHRVGAFFLGGKNRRACELIQQLVRNWPRIKEHAYKNRNSVPFAFEIPARGKKFKELTIT